eukprot:TRINITY_DN65353_c0_g1_i1.p2 TRINITY_DN65353_c0_g1~~TRINITY_DN65353_c0_g1_i1.p2  ORF type:complete len:122 (-),score=18.15 TRINITY_DN65353_c0_g1_i1:103-468(-)
MMVFVDILLLLLTPPGLYVVLGFIGILTLLFLVSYYKEEINAAIITVLDFFYPCFQATRACCIALHSCMQRTIYPVKESIYSAADAIDLHRHYYKVRRPFMDVPTFRYGQPAPTHVPSFSY